MAEFKNLIDVKIGIVISNVNNNVFKKKINIL